MLIFLQPNGSFNIGTTRHGCPEETLFVKCTELYFRENPSNYIVDHIGSENTFGIGAFDLILLRRSNYIAQRAWLIDIRELIYDNYEGLQF